MSYIDVPNASKGITKEDVLTFLNDIRSRKEFNQLSYGENTDVQTYASQFLQLHGPQIFVKNFTNNNTPYKRLFINWQTGTGKTIAALSIAREFVNKTKQKKIFIVGFTKQLFINELLSHPEFGFISKEELQTLKQLKQNADQTSIKSNENKKLTDYITQLKRRLTEVGYFKFYGYKELSNKLFLPTPKAYINNFDIKTLFKTSIIKRDRFLEELQIQIEAGNIVINEDLMNSMRHSLLIADEIHNLYNMETENNYGVAIQYILDTLSKDGPYTVLLSATPMTGSATEAIDLLNLLIRKEYLPNGKHLLKSDYFDMTQAVSIPKPGTIETLGLLSAGRTSFLLDLGKSSYPKRIFEGENISDIPYLKFTSCVMPNAQQMTISSESCSVSSNFLYDFAFPDPEEEGSYITNSQDFKSKYSNASETWKEKNGIQLLYDGPDIIVSGPILQKDSLKLLSAKYATLIDMILDVIKSKDSGKILVYHHMVHSTGVLFIQEILKMNGFIDDTTNPTNDTICNVCTLTKREHTSESDHEFIPIRFITIHSNIERNQIMNSIDKFNSLENLEGTRYRLLIGSKIIREGYNFKAVRHQFITTLPNDIPTLLQVFGRVVRRNSHISLPIESRNVKIHILVSTNSGGKIEESELCRYKKKIQEFVVIQEIERSIRKYSIDSFLSYEALTTAFPEIKSSATLDALPYTPEVESSDNSIQNTKLVTYNAYGYSEKEVFIIMDIIWVIMSIQPVWTYDDLYQAVIGERANILGNISHFGYNPKSFTKESYNLALHYLSKKTNTLGMNTVFTIVFCDPYYILCPLNKFGIPLVVPEIHFRMLFTNKNASNRTDLAIQSIDNNVRTVDTTKIEEEFNTNMYPELTLLSFDALSHYNLIENIIKTCYLSYEKTTALDVYLRFKIILTIKQVLKVPNLSKVISGDTLKDLSQKDDKLPIAYITDISVKLYNGSTFIDLPISYFDYSNNRQENDIIIGFTSSTTLKTQFLIRPPIKNYNDKRMVPRGADCLTRVKGDLVKIVNKLESHCKQCKKWLSKNYVMEKLRTNELCKKIKLILLTLEEESRSKDHKLVWLYLFNEKSI